MIGLDTETIDGRAFVMAVPEQYWPVESFEECWDFLSTWAREDAARSFVAYNLDFDVRAMLAHLPRESLWVLARAGSDFWGPYHFRWIPGKVFECWTGKTDKVRIYDAFQYFGCRLEKAAHDYLGESKGDPGIPWNQFAECRVNSDLMRRVGQYCQQDAHLAQRLMEYVLDNLAGLGLEDVKPLSPAYMAGRFFMKGRRHKLPDFLQRIGWACYHGGRAEMFQRGAAKRAFYYDIHSAYPAVMNGMEEWEDLDYVASRERHDSAVYGCYLVSLRIPEYHIGPVPFGRSLLFYPTGEFDTWVSLPSFAWLEAHGFIREVREAHEFCDNPKHDWQARPLGKMRELYDVRKLPGMGLAAKLLMNGLSGKLAQLDERWVALDRDPDPVRDDMIEHGIAYKLERKLGAYTNYVLAAHVTDVVRVRLLDAMYKDPFSIVACATDGIITTRPLDIPTGPKLGEWDYEEISELLFLQSGVYEYTDSQGERHTKLRGFDSRACLRELLDKTPHAQVVKVPARVPNTLLYALQRDRPINEIADFERTLDLNADTKRHWTRRTDCGTLLAGLESSSPHKVR